MSDEADCGRFEEVLRRGPVQVGAVNRPPDHYKTETGAQPFDVIDMFGLDFYEGNAVKYILRWRKKGGIDDLRKAQHYIEEIIVRTQGQP